MGAQSDTASCPLKRDPFFRTSLQNPHLIIFKIFINRQLDNNSVVKEYLTTEEEMSIRPTFMEAVSILLLSETLFFLFN